MFDPSIDDPFAEVEDLEAFTTFKFDEGTEDTIEAVQAAEALADASAQIRSWCQQTIWPVTEAVYEPDEAGEPVWLPHPPAIPVTVTKVEVAGVELDPSGWRHTRLHEVRPAAGGGWTGPVKVTYEHGFDDPPPAVRGVCLQLAARTMANPEGRMQWRTASGESTAFAAEPEGAHGLSKTHEKQLRPYRLEGVA